MSNTRVVARLLACFILTVSLWVPFHSRLAEAGNCHVVAGQLCPPPVTVDGATFEYQYVDSDQTFYAIPIGGHVHDGDPGTFIPQEYEYQPNCSDNHAPDPGGQANGGALCIGAVTICGDGSIQLQVWARDAGTNDQWRLIGLECIGGPPTITLPHLITDLLPRLQWPHLQWAECKRLRLRLTRQPQPSAYSAEFLRVDEKTSRPMMAATLNPVHNIARKF